MNAQIKAVHSVNLNTHAHLSYVLLPSLCVGDRALAVLLLKLGCIVAHLLQSLGICRPNEVSLHVVDTARWSHQVLIVLALDLDHPHHYPIDHVHGLSLFILAIVAVLLILVLHSLSEVVLYLGVALVIDSILDSLLLVIEV